jgi:pyruvate,water dikinase
MTQSSASEYRSSCVIRHDGARDSDRLGGKARALASAGTAGFLVPPWVVLTPEAFERSLDDSLRKTLAAVDAHDPVTLAHLALEPEIEANLKRELRELVGEGKRFAVRSSADDEDSAEHSFAGQLESYLFVALEDVPARVADVWRSGFSERVFAYRSEHGLDGPPTPPAVLIQVMVDADVSGVAFSVDPVSGDHDIAVVGSLYGLGTALVSGEADADTHHVDGQDEIVSRELATKIQEHRFASSEREGVAAIAVAAGRAVEWALSDAEVIAVARLARQAETSFGLPQDIEWAIADGRLYLLQSRPVTSLARVADKNGVLNIWDNSNIAESYNGVTTPLTFSFARNAYEGVYRQLCHIFGLPQARIRVNRVALENMIGLIRGRVYYNVLNWYRLLAQSPGYRMNAAFFEQMIGLQEAIPDAALDRDRPVSWRARLVDGLRLARSAASILVNFLVLDRKVRGFHRRVEAALVGRPELSSLPADALVEEYRLLVDRLITRWDAPLINDFFAMIFYGVLRKQCASWCGDETETLQNDLLCASGGMVSTEPAERLQRMARLIRDDEEFIYVLRTGQTRDIVAAMQRRGEFRKHYESYLQKFGERCSEELKLESSTLHDDPLMLLRAVGSLAFQGARSTTSCGAEQNLRHDAEARADEALRSRPLRRIIFNGVLYQARRTIRNRENLRLERTRVFGRVRRIFVELGARMHDIGALGDPRDIFYLHVDEVLGFVEGSGIAGDLTNLVTLRRAEFDGYASEDPPPDRFETHGIVQNDLSFLNRTRSGETLSGDTRKGTGCCPGRVSGQVRVISDPRTAVLSQGEILVAERTDPGWIMLFPFAAGLLVERGNLLSHSAIVAREMGIPAIVAIEGVTRWLSDGDAVEFDGATGVIRKVAKADE